MCNTKLLNFMLLLFLPLLLTPDTFGGEADTKPKAKSAKANFVVTVKNNLISLKAKDASLKEVLEEIGRQMKIDVVANVPDQERITLEFEKLSIEEAVNKLSRNYLFVADSVKGETKITKIIVVEAGNETALSRPTVKEFVITKEERSVKPESKVREEAVKKESPPPEPFKFEFDPSQFEQKRR
jgi:type II secretory pathway component GspD/PulD (secretin)